MATVYQVFLPEEAQFLSTLFPQLVKNGTNFPVSGLAFDGATITESAYWKFPAHSYGSGNLTLLIEWYAAAITGDIRLLASIAAVTPNSDPASIEAKAFATAVAGTDTAMGTTKELASFSITIDQLDSIAANDECFLKLSRDPTHSSDTMSGDCIVTLLKLSYSDT